MRPPGWKKAICAANISLTSAFLSSVEDYLKLLRLPSGKLLINLRRKTGFIGLIINMKSARIYVIGWLMKVIYYFIYLCIK